MVGYQSLNDLIYDEIKNRIISNRYAPGDRLEIDHIAKELEVSRTPIVNALKALEKDGYVNIAPRSGTHVRKYSKDEIEALFDFREALEGVVVKRAVALADPDKLNFYIEQFAEILHMIQNENKVQSTEEYYRLQTEFHMYLWELSPPIIRDELQNIVDLTKRICKRHLYYSFLQENHVAFYEKEIGTHVHIAEAVLNKNVEEAVSWIHKDISQTKDAILHNYDAIENLDFQSQS